jgi:hypothetical protein
VQIRAGQINPVHAARLHLPGLPQGVPDSRPVHLCRHTGVRARHAEGLMGPICRDSSTSTRNCLLCRSLSSYSSRRNFH